MIWSRKMFCWSNRVDLASRWVFNNSSTVRIRIHLLNFSLFHFHILPTAPKKPGDRFWIVMLRKSTRLYLYSISFLSCARSNTWRQIWHGNRYVVIGLYISWITDGICIISRWRWKWSIGLHNWAVRHATAKIAGPIEANEKLFLSQRLSTVLFGWNARRWPCHFRPRFIAARERTRSARFEKLT